jgi:hypothetical protein
MKPERLNRCPVCRGEAIVTGATDYPNLEQRRWCPNCEAGQKLADKLAEIVARTLAAERTRAA